MPFKKNPPAYTVWASMKDRCRNPNNPAWANYGGRGIGYCSQWERYSNWAADMLPRLPGFSLERIDNNAGYSPCNCYWADKKTQQRNQRRAVFVEIEGVRHRAIELAERFGVKTDTIVARAAKGMSFAEVTFQGRYVDISGVPAAVAARVAAQRARTHCKRGHELTDANTYITKQGWRNCRKCHAEKAARQRKAKARDA
jgi:hypothetical protein